MNRPPSKQRDQETKFLPAVEGAVGVLRFDSGWDVAGGPLNPDVAAHRMHLYPTLATALSRQEGAMRDGHAGKQAAAQFRGTASSQIALLVVFGIPFVLFRALPAVCFGGVTTTGILRLNPPAAAFPAFIEDVRNLRIDRC
jgi:hypothetical protein